MNVHQFDGGGTRTGDRGNICTGEAFRLLGQSSCFSGPRADDGLLGSKDAKVCPPPISPRQSFASVCLLALLAA